MAVARASTDGHSLDEANNPDHPKATTLSAVGAQFDNWDTPPAVPLEQNWGTARRSRIYPPSECNRQRPRGVVVRLLMRWRAEWGTQPYDSSMALSAGGGIRARDAVARTTRGLVLSLDRVGDPNLAPVHDLAPNTPYLYYLCLSPPDLHPNVEAVHPILVSCHHRSYQTMLYVRSENGTLFL